MMKTKTSQIIRLGLLLLIVSGLLVIVPILLTSRAPVASVEQGASIQEVAQMALGVRVAEAAPVSIDLCASDGSITLPDSTVVPVWGFVDTGGGSCTTGLVDDSNFPGPELQVTADDNVTINLSNSLPVTTSLLIPGQVVTATGSISDDAFTAEAAANGGTASYNFIAKEGTYLYESGSNPSIQIPMGLYGALVVDSGLAPSQAYGQLFDQEEVLLLSEIDPNLNANPGGFDLLDYKPTYWLINGQGYPDSANIMVNEGDQVLLRYLNAGFDHPSMELLGAYQRVIAKDGFALANDFNVIAETIAAGTTADMIVDSTGLGGSSLPLYNRNMYVTNADAYPGGMLTFLTISAPIGNPPTVDVVSPAQGSTVYGTMVTVQIDASDIEDAAGSLTVEWNLDGGAWQTAAPTGGTLYQAIWDTTATGDGGHTISARATDSDANTASDSNGVIVSNAPMVNVLAPAEGATVYGDALVIEIEATDAEDTPGSLTVTFDVDGGASLPAAYDGSDIYTATVDTTLLAEGAHTINAQATDSRSIVGGDSNNVTVSNQPSLTIVNPASDSNVSGQVTVRIDASDAEDDAGGAGGLTVTWDVDGGASQSTTYDGGTGYYEANWDTTADGPGIYTVNAQMMDSRGNSASDSSTNITVTAPNSIHIGDLDNDSVQAGGPNWSARVTAEVHDGNEVPVAGAEVFMDVTRILKADGTAETTAQSCITGANGRCTVIRQVNEMQYENAVTFTVTDVTNPPADPYDSNLNHDVDGGSNGTTLVVDQP